MAPLLPYLLTTVKAIKCKKLTLRDRQSLRADFGTLSSGHQYSLLNRENFPQPI